MSEVPRRAPTDPDPSKPNGIARRAAAERLAERLSARSQVLRLRAAADFTLIEALLRAGHPGAAACALDAHREALRSYAGDVVSMVADAERDAAPVEIDLPSDDDVRAARARVAGGRARQEAAAVAEDARELHESIRSLPDALLTRADVRSQIDVVLAREQRTLNELATAHPQARDLLDEIPLLRASLNLPPHLEPVRPAAATRRD